MKAKKQWITPEVTEIEINFQSATTSDGATSGGKS